MPRKVSRKISRKISRKVSRKISNNTKCLYGIFEVGSRPSDVTLKALCTNKRSLVKIFCNIDSSNAFKELFFIAKVWPNMPYAPDYFDIFEASCSKYDFICHGCYNFIKNTLLDKGFDINKFYTDNLDNIEFMEEKQDSWNYRPVPFVSTKIQKKYYGIFYYDALQSLWTSSLKANDVLKEVAKFDAPNYYIKELITNKEIR